MSLWLITLCATYSTLPTQLDDLLNKQTFKGQWLDHQHKLPVLKTEGGDFYIEFYSAIKDKETKVHNASVFFLCPKYVTQPYAVVEFSINSTGMGLWSGRQNATIYPPNNSSYHCMVNYSIEVQGYEQYELKNVTTRVSLVGDQDQDKPECIFTMNTGWARYRNFVQHQAFYSFVLTLVFALQLFCLDRLLKELQGNMLVNKLSLATICLCYVEDTFDSTFRIFTFINSFQFELFVLPFVFLIAYLLFLAKLLGMVWIDNYGPDLGNPRTRMRYFLISMLVLMLISTTYQVLVSLFFGKLISLLIPVLSIYMQIFYNIYKGNNPGFFPAYVFGLLGTRLLMSFYYWGCPENIFLQEPNLLFCTLQISLYLIAVLILYLQFRCGPIFCIPKSCRPGYFNYQFQIRQDLEDPLCSICMENLFFDNGPGVRTSLLAKRQIIFRTPCNHMFHPECLRDWINVRMQCPTCRAAIPAAD